MKGKRVAEPATLLRIKATLRKALNDAIRKHRLLDYNPAAYVEFDGVVIAETRFGNDQLIDLAKEAAHIQSRWQLLRVAISRARHHVVIVRHASQPPLIS